MGPWWSIRPDLSNYGSYGSYKASNRRTSPTRIFHPVQIALFKLVFRFLIWATILAKVAVFPGSQTHYLKLSFFDITEVSDRLRIFTTAMKFRICLMPASALFGKYWSFGCAWCSFSYALCSLCWAIAGNWRKCRTRCSSPCTSLALLSIFARFWVIACGIVRFLKLKIVYGKLGCMLWSHLG